MGRKPYEHNLKVWPEFFDDLESGAKTFEVRHDDRGFCVGDSLMLREFRPSSHFGGGDYTGREVRRRVTYILRGGRFGIHEAVVVMGLTKEESDG